MAYLPEPLQLEGLYLRHAPQLFALCYLHSGGVQKANALLHTLLCDLLSSPRRWQRACGSVPGLFRCAQAVCLEQQYKRPRRKKGQQPGGSHAPLPFTMTDALRALLKLPPKYKTPLYLRLALGWSAQEAAAAIGCPPARVDRLVARGLGKCNVTEERAAQALASIAPHEHGPQAVWDAFLVERSEKDFAGRDRLRRFKRGLDAAIPYIALGVVAFSVFAYCGVEHGWFSGQPYAPAPEEPRAESAPVFPTGTLTVFSPQEDGLVQYTVTDAPLSFPALVRQMVALGGAPEGTALLQAAWGDSCGTVGNAIEPTARNLVLELSADAGEWFAAASPDEQEQMLRAMACTFSAACPALEQLRLVSAGTELTAGPSSAQDFLPAAPAPVRTVDTPYRE